MTPRAFTAIAWHTVFGRGRIAVVRLDDVDALALSPGDTVEIDGAAYTVRGVEMSRILSDPPRWDAEVGLLVRPVVPDTERPDA